MIFLNPAYLWALLGLAVPVAIHLWSRRQGRTIKIGSLEFLRKKDPKRSSSINPNELWLLLLRLLVLSILVFIIAEPRIITTPENTPITYLVEPSLLSKDEVRTILDSLDPETVRLLKPGFPLASDENSQELTEQPHYWQLAEEMQDLKTDSIVVFTRALVSGLKGKRPGISGHISWVILNPEIPERTPIRALKKGQEVILTYVSTDSSNLRFDEKRQVLSENEMNINDKGDSLSVSGVGKSSQIPLRNFSPLKVLLVHNDSLPDELRILKASYAALEVYLEHKIEMEIVPIKNIPVKLDDYRSLIWLSALPVINIGVPTIIYRPDSLANNILARTSNHQHYQLTKPLTPENSIEFNLPDQLLELLLLNEDLEERLGFYDKRSADLQDLQPGLSQVLTDKNPLESNGFSLYLWLILLVVLIAERGLSYLRKQ